MRLKPLQANEGPVSVLKDFYRLHHFVTLVAEVIFVNSVPFLVTLLRKIKLQTVKHVPNCTDVLLSSSLIKVIKMYQMGGICSDPHPDRSGIRQIGRCNRKY